MRKLFGRFLSSLGRMFTWRSPLPALPSPIDTMAAALPWMPTPGSARELYVSMLMAHADRLISQHGMIATQSHRVHDSNCIFDHYLAVMKLIREQLDAIEQERTEQETEWRARLN